MLEQVYSNALISNISVTKMSRKFLHFYKKKIAILRQFLLREKVSFLRPTNVSCTNSTTQKGTKILQKIFVLLKNFLTTDSVMTQKGSYMTPLKKLPLWYNYL